MPDSGAIDAALSQRLLSDVTLAAMMPDGVYFDIVPQGTRPAPTRFVVVSVLNADDTPMQTDARAFEDVLYLVKAVALATTGADVRAAADRIDTLLDGQPLTIDGYSLMRLNRVARIRYTEVDDADKDIRWQHRGGHYAVMVSP